MLFQAYIDISILVQARTLPSPWVPSTDNLNPANMMPLPSSCYCLSYEDSNYKLQCIDMTRVAI